MDIFKVVCYINKEVAQMSLFEKLDTAIDFANFMEDRGYICEIEKYQYQSIISRGFWRNEKVEDASDISI